MVSHKERYFAALMRACNKYQTLKLSAAKKSDFVKKQLTTNEQKCHLSDLYTPLHLISNHEYYQKKSKAYKQDASEESKEKNGRYHVILSEPGGGKTTWMSMMILEYFGDEGGNKEAIERETPVSIQKRLLSDKNDGYWPVLMHIRTDFIESRYGIQSKESFEDIITFVVERLLVYYSDDENTSEIIDEFKKHVQNGKLCLFIDGIDEFSDLGMQESFLDFLAGYLRKHEDTTVFISSRQGNYKRKKIQHALLNSLNAGGSNLDFEEWVIDVLLESNDVIERFADKWYDNMYPGQKREKKLFISSFTKTLKRNKQIRSLITTPLELTNMLFILCGTSYYAEDVNELYKETIDLLLKWHQEDGWIPQDVERHLSCLSYKMSVSQDSRIVVDTGRILSYFKEIRLEQKDYFRGEYGTENGEILKYIRKIINNTGILTWVEEEKTIAFRHLLFGAYFCSNAIVKKQFPKSLRLANRYEYFAPHLQMDNQDSDDYWNQIILFAVMQDDSVRDRIIEQLIKLGDQDAANERFLGLLLEIFGFPGIKPDPQNRMYLYNMLVRQENWKLFQIKLDELQLMFSNLREEDNIDFIRVVTDKWKSFSSEAEKIRFGEAVADIVFYILLFCKVNEESISEAVQICFRDVIDSRMIQFIFELAEQKSLNTSRALNMIKTGAAEAIRAEKTDYLSIASMTRCADSGQNCWEYAYGLLTGAEEESIYGVNMIGSLAWLMSLGKRNIGSDKDFSMNEDLPERMCPFILQGILEGKEYFRNECVNAFMQLYLAEMIRESYWYTKEMFGMMYGTLCEMEDDGTEEYYISVTNALSVLATFPITEEYKRLAKELYKERPFPESVLTILKSELAKRLDKTSDGRILIAFKILVLVDYWTEDELIENKKILIGHWRSKQIFYDQSSKSYWKSLCDANLIQKEDLEEQMAIISQDNQVDDPFALVNSALSLLKESEKTKEDYQTFIANMAKLSSENISQKEVVEWWSELLRKDEEEAVLVILALSHYGCIFVSEEAKRHADTLAKKNAFLCDAFGYYKELVYQYSEAEKYYRIAIDLYEKNDETDQMCDTLMELGELYKKQYYSHCNSPEELLDQASECYQKAADLYRQSGESFLFAKALRSLCEMKNNRGDLEGAYSLLKTIEKIYNELSLNEELEGIYELLSKFAKDMGLKEEYEHYQKLVLMQNEFPFGDW